MKDDLSLWVGVSYGIVAGFQQWQLQQGYSIGERQCSISNNKDVCKLANQAECLSQEEMSKIRGIENISHKDGRNVMRREQLAELERRKLTQFSFLRSMLIYSKRSCKEASRTDHDAARDYLLFCLLADHGLRMW